MKIIYPNGDGTITDVWPAPEFLTKYTLKDVADSAVPKDTAYIFVEDEDMPPEDGFRDAWEADFSSPDGVSIGNAAWWAAHKDDNK